MPSLYCKECCKLRWCFVVWLNVKWDCLVWGSNSWYLAILTAKGQGFLWEKQLMSARWDSTSIQREECWSDSFCLRNIKFLYSSLNSVMARTKLHAVWELFIVYFILILMEAVIQCWHNSSKQHLQKIKTQYPESSLWHKSKLQSNRTELDQKLQKVKPIISYPLAYFCLPRSSKDP